MGYRFLYVLLGVAFITSFQCVSMRDDTHASVMLQFKKEKSKREVRNIEKQIPHRRRRASEDGRLQEFRQLKIPTMDALLPQKAEQMANTSRIDSTARTRPSNGQDCVATQLVIHSDVTHLWGHMKGGGACDRVESLQVRQVSGISYCVRYVRSDGAAPIQTEPADVTVVLHSLLCFSWDAFDAMLSSLHQGATLTTCSIANTNGIVTSAGYDTFFKRAEEGDYSLQLFPRMEGAYEGHAHVSERSEERPVAVVHPMCFALFHPHLPYSKSVRQLILERNARFVDSTSRHESDSAFRNELGRTILHAAETHRHFPDSAITSTVTSREGFEFEGFNPPPHRKNSTPDVARVYTKAQKEADDTHLAPLLPEVLHSLQRHTNVSLQVGALLEETEEFIACFERCFSQIQTILAEKGKNTHKLAKRVRKAMVEVSHVQGAWRALRDTLLTPLFPQDAYANETSSTMTEVPILSEILSKVGNDSYREVYTTLPSALADLAAGFDVRQGRVKSAMTFLSLDATAVKLSELVLETGCVEVMDQLGAGFGQNHIEHKSLFFRLCEKVFPRVRVSGGAKFNLNVFSQKVLPGALPRSSTIKAHDSNEPLVGLSYPRRGAASQDWEGITVAWALPCCKCCGFVNEAIDIMTGLLELGVPVRIVTPLSDCMCDAFPPHVEHLFSSIYVAGQELVNYSKKKASRKVLLVTHGVPTDFEAIWKHAGFNESEGDFDRFFMIARVMYEFTVAPPGFLGVLNKYIHEAWVPSQFVATMLKNSSFKRGVHVFPEAVDIARFFKLQASTVLFDPPIPKEHIITFGADDAPDNFKFFSMFKWEDRKGWDVLLETFMSSFSDKENVSLYIHTIPHLGPLATRQNITSAALRVISDLRRSQLPHVSIFHQT